MSTETTITVVAIGHEMQTEPVLVADDGRRDITAWQPKIKNRSNIYKAQEQK